MALLLTPPFVGQLLFGVEMVGVVTTIARLAGIALIGLGVTCWPGTPLLGMVTYSVAAALYLAYVGLSGGPSGMLLWPAVIAHVILGRYCLGVILKPSQPWRSAQPLAD